MTGEDQLAARFGAFLDDGGSGDWDDVRRRARKPVRRTALLAVLTAALTVAVAGPALGLHRTVIDWLEAEPAPERVQLDFIQLGVGAPSGMDPGVIPNSARRVTTVRHEGKTHILWVAPTRAGGFCYLWTDLGGGCRAERTIVERPPRAPGDLDSFALGVSSNLDRLGVVRKLTGAMLLEEVERVVVRYADGEEAEVDYVWVSQPIDAGFFLFGVPAEHTRGGAHLTAIEARDESGGVVARQTFQLVPPTMVETQKRLPDGTEVHLPAGADASRARKLFDFTASNGAQIWAWVMPTADGGRCWIFVRGRMCPPAGYPQTRPLEGGLSGGRIVLFNGHVTDAVAAVELRYEDGTVERVTPRERMVLHEIGVAHYARGRRLELAVALGPFGQEVGRQEFEPGSTGLYPCERPIDIGHGVMSCP